MEKIYPNRNQNAARGLESGERVCISASDPTASSTEENNAIVDLWPELFCQSDGFAHLCHFSSNR